jgi:hypothetical protein
MTKPNDFSCFQCPEWSDKNGCKMHFNSLEDCVFVDSEMSYDAYRYMGYLIGTHVKQD